MHATPEPHTSKLISANTRIWKLYLPQVHASTVVEWQKSLPVVDGQQTRELVVPADVQTALLSRWLKDADVQSADFAHAIHLLPFDNSPNSKFDILKPSLSTVDMAIPSKTRLFEKHVVEKVVRLVKDGKEKRVQLQALAFRWSNWCFCAVLLRSCCVICLIQVRPARRRTTPGSRA